MVTRLALVHQRFSRIPSQPGTWHNHSDTCVTMVRSTPSEEITAECRPEKNCLKAMLLGMTSKILPVVLQGKSDSSSMDMAVELLLATGRSLPEVMMMMVPEAWERHLSMDDDKKAFYEYNACIMEP